MILRRLMLASMLAAAAPAAALAHGEAAHGKRPAAKAAPFEEKPFGRPGDPKKVSRTIHIDMNDGMEFLPNGLRLKAGDTVRFVVRNSGKVMHELVIGTMEELKAHAALMRKFPDMEHDEPYMVHVKPGGTGAIVWQFTNPGAFYYGCLVPGHFEAGMVGIVRVRAD